MQYHYHLQGFIYNLLKGSKYDYVHDKEGYKFFCFSNIFPAKDLVKNDLRTLIISSPSSEFISYLNDALGRRNEVVIGGMKFKIEYAEKPNSPLSYPFTLITGTPIIIRIPRERYKAYSVEPKGKYGYVYWRSDHPVDLFVSQIENNLTKRYVEYFNLGSKSAEEQTLSLLQKFKFKKQVSVRVHMKGFDQVIIGTIWEFEFDAGVNMDMIRFALDSGLGERNSLGFGFMNIINK